MAIQAAVEDRLRRAVIAPSASDERSAPWASRRRGALAATLLFLACLAVYYPALSGQLLWDDDAHVTPPALRTWEGLERIWTEPGATQQYFPLLYSAFWWEFRLWGEASLGYHLTNVVLHVVAAALLAVVLKRLAVVWPWFAASLFALHPVSVESVAWITEQKNTLSAVFGLACILAFLRFSDCRSLRSYFAASLLFACALLSKTVWSTLPAALLVILWWRRRRLSWRGEVVPLLPWFLASLLAGLVTVFVEHRLISDGGAGSTLDPAQRLLIAGRAVWFYAGKLIWPVNLTFSYPRWELDAHNLWQWLAPAGALIAVVTAWARRRSTPGALALLLLYLGTLFPLLGFLDVFAFRYSFVADHFQYHASMVGLTALSTLVERASAGLAERQRVAVPVLMLTGCAILTSQYARNYTDPETHYRAVIARNPESWMALNNLAMIIAKTSPEEAIGLLRSGLALRDDAFEMQFNLGNLLVASDRLDEAQAPYRRAVSLRPDSVPALNNLGNLLRRLGRAAEALGFLERAVSLSPGSVETRVNLGAVLTRLGREKEAVRHLREAVRLDPVEPMARLNLGLALARSGDWWGAIREYETGARLDPASPELSNNLGEARLHVGDLDAALAAFRRALVLEPAFPEAENNLGVALSLAGRTEESRAHFAAALRIRPGYASALRNLELSSGSAGQRR